MAHPFFEVNEFPWYRPEASSLHELLIKLTPMDGAADSINLWYVRCGKMLPLLTPGRACPFVWKEVLDNLTRFSRCQAHRDHQGRIQHQSRCGANLPGN